MSTVTFDKLRFINTLKADNEFSDKQAEKLANAIDDALKETVATKYDIELLRRDLTIKLYTVAGIVIGIILAAIKFLWLINNRNQSLLR